MCCVLLVVLRPTDALPGQDWEVRANISLSYQEAPALVHLFEAKLKMLTFFPATETVSTVAMLSLHFCVAFFHSETC